MRLRISLSILLLLHGSLLALAPDDVLREDVALVVRSVGERDHVSPSSAPDAIARVALDHTEERRDTSALPASVGSLSTQVGR